MVVFIVNYRTAKSLLPGIIYFYIHIKEKGNHGQVHINPDNQFEIKGTLHLAAQ